jgi:Predicted S-adenosylmethionine-dependent methyltransferase involved in cell envelope biogenesis
MRMDTTQKLTAYDVVNYYREQDLYNIIKTYGEEKFASKIAKSIVEYRKRKNRNHKRACRYSV